MISITIQKILDKQELTEEERLQLVYWFESMQNAPQQLQTLFAGAASRISAVSQITPNLGVMVSGKFITPGLVSTSNIPTEAGFTGSFMSGNGETFNGSVYNIGGVNVGQLQWGASQTDGSLVAAGGLVKMNNEGVSFASQGVMLNMASSYPIYRTGFFLGGLYVKADSAVGTKFGIHSFAKNGAALIDETFEAGLGAWTQTGSPTLATTYKVSGSYSLQIDSSNYITKGVSVTANSWYLVSMKVRITSQSSKLSIDGETITYIPNDAWTLIYFLYKAPSTTTWNLTIKGTGANAVYIDDVYVYNTTVFGFNGTEFDGEGSYVIRATNGISLGNALTQYVVRVLSTSLQINPSLLDLDMVVGGDTDAALLVTDASTDRVGIGTATPGYKLDVAGTVNVSTGNTYKINGTDVLSSTATGRTQEEIEDFVGAMVSGNTETGISVTYDDTGGKLNFDAQTAGDARYTMLDGWISGSGTWSYSSADSPTFVISINADVTALIGVGDRIKLTQTTAKYFIVTAVGAWSGSATLVTVYGGTDYTLANAAISSPYYSHAKIPFGFPQDPDKWTVSASNSVNANKTPPSANTWYGGAGLTNTGISIDVPIGIWKGFYKGVLESTDTTVTDYNIYSTLSTANNTESDTNNTFFVALTVPSGTYKVWSVVSPPVIINVAAKTTYYMNIKTSTSTADSIHIRGDVVPTIIKLVCAYL